ncbi:hypothetical protein IKW72_03560 [bacterium]|nr:hypothetical protein [bacterium]
MKKLLLFFVLFAISVNLKAEPTVFFSENFESYEEGDFFSQRDDLKYYQEDFKDDYSYDITNVTTKCLSVMKISAGWYDNSGLWIPMGTQPSVFTDSGVLRIRFQIKSSYNYAGVMLGDGEEGRALYCYRNGGTFYIKNDDYEYGVGGVGDQVFTPVEFNISYPSRRLMNVIINSVTNTPENFVLDEVNVNYFGVGVFGANPPKCAPIDDIEAAYESLYEPVPKVSADILEYSPEEGSKILVIANDGGGYFNYSVQPTENLEWLAFSGTNGVCASACELEIALNRSEMTNGYYKTKLLVDLGTFGQRYVTLRAGSGKVFFYENFESPYMKEGEITGQYRWDGKKEDGYGKPYNEMTVTNVDFGINGRCAHFVRGGGWDGYTCKIDAPKKAVVRVSMKLYKGSDGDLNEFAIRQNYWNNAADLNLRCSGEGVKIYGFCSREEKYPLVGETTAPLDEWFPLSFTLDYERYVLTSLTFGDFTTNYAKGIPLRNMPNDFTNPTDFLDRLAISGGGENTGDAALFIDDLTVEIIPREYKPIPNWGGVTNLGDEGLTNVFSTTVLNYGAKDFDYALKVLDYSYWFLPYSVSGSVSRSSSLWFIIYKNFFPDGFFRSRVVMNYWDWDEANRGALTSLYTYSKGGWHYASDFEEPYYKLGYLGGQDTWTAKGEQSVAAFDKRQCLAMGGAGYARTSLKIPKNSEYRLRLLYYMESSGENCSVRISGDNESLRDMDKNLKGNFPLYINLDPESGESELFCMAEGVLTNLMSAPLDEWNELSVVVDSTPANGCIRSISLNDDLKEFGDGELPVEERYLDKDIDMLEIAMAGDAIFYVDNLTVSSGSVPEPWLFTLTAAVCLLLKRSRKLLNVS